MRLIELICAVSPVVANDSESLDYEMKILFPSESDVLHAFNRLDGKYYPSLLVVVHASDGAVQRYCVLGDGSRYSLSLLKNTELESELQEEFESIDYETYLGDSGTRYVALGNGYPGWEIDSWNIAVDREMAAKAIRYFCATGDWYPEVAYLRTYYGDVVGHETDIG